MSCRCSVLTSDLVSWSEELRPFLACDQVVLPPSSTMDV